VHQVREDDAQPCLPLSLDYCCILSQKHLYEEARSFHPLGSVENWVLGGNTRVLVFLSVFVVLCKAEEGVILSIAVSIAEKPLVSCSFKRFPSLCFRGETF
jgi:hypothetical protein